MPADVSFVSVTQQFNTTTSMGRLTLNVLLSFAQFEREVTAERIRDKIAASKKKGMWMGGTVPLGYRAENRKLVIEEAEAKTVRLLFDRYLDLKSVRALAEGQLQQSCAGERRKASKKQLLANRSVVATSTICFQTRSISARCGIAIWSTTASICRSLKRKCVCESPGAAQTAGARGRSAHQNTPDSHLLTGIVFDETGDRLSPTHARKSGKRYRYYVSSRLIGARKKGSDGWRVPASQLGIAG